MVLKNFRIIALSIVFSALLSACGGGSDGSSDSNTAPIAQISSGSEFIEGTTFIDINGGNSSDSNGTVESYQWSIEDNDGVTSISITDDTSNSTQITGIPAVISADIVITIGLIVKDNEGESSSKVTKIITIKNNVGAVDTSGFDGIWYSPCFNNRFGFSVRQTLNINGSSLISDITSHTAGSTPARNCVTPGSGQTIFSDANASLNFGSQVSTSSCLNGNGVNTGLNISSVRTSGTTYTSSSEIDDVLALVTGYRDILPNDSVVCRTESGNLIFGGTVYTPNPSNVNVDVIDANIDSAISWQVGNSVYAGGGAGASASTTNDTANDRFGIVVVGTSNDTSNGVFSGSSLTITHSLSGSGLYSVTDNIGVNSDNKVSISVTVGSATTQATSYESVNAINNVEVIIDENGVYHFTLSSPVFLEKGVEVNGGVAGAPDTIDFTMNNIFDYSN